MKTKDKPVKNNKMLETARALRRDMTPQERKLWYAFLRSYPVKIYKQRIIESYVVDFYCARARLVIELDGPVHHSSRTISHDAGRDARLRVYGLEILRISNDAVDSDFGRVCAHIDRIIQRRLDALSSNSCPEERSEGAKEPQAKT